jgi:hypothetical protein
MTVIARGDAFGLPELNSLTRLRRALICVCRWPAGAKGSKSTGSSRVLDNSCRARSRREASSSSSSASQTLVVDR